MVLSIIISSFILLLFKEVLIHLFITCTFKAKRGTWHCLVEGYLASLHDFVSLKVKHPTGTRMISIPKKIP
jgi:hypothetical protein